MKKVLVIGDGRKYSAQLLFALVEVRDYEKELNLDEKYLESLSDKELQDYLEKLERLYIK